MELTNMATAISFEGSGGGSSGTLIEKTITENGTYYAADDGADGYSKVSVVMGDIQPLTVTENGWYEAYSYEYNCDGFNPVTVNVQGEYVFCDDINYNDISPIVDFSDYQNYLYDTRVGFGVRVSVEDSGHTLKLYKVDTDGTETQIYSDTSQSVYSDAYIEISDSSTGEIDIKYDLSGQATTVTEIISAIEQYGGAGHGFIVRGAVQ